MWLSQSKSKGLSRRGLGWTVKDKENKVEVLALLIGLAPAGLYAGTHLTGSWRILGGYLDIDTSRYIYIAFYCHRLYISENYKYRPPFTKTAF
jgi:hypothetical protein